MSDIKEILEDNEIEMILYAIQAQEKKCRGIANKPIQGFRAGEKEKKQEWASKADSWLELETKIAYMLI